MYETNNKCSTAVFGCMIGGAAGDALGYAVEFMTEQQIFTRHGMKGIQDYEIDPETGKALISDDTQMSLFTANSILLAQSDYLHNDSVPLHRYAEECYEEWYMTQTMSYHEYQEKKQSKNKRFLSWLMEIPELYEQRAPGTTCLSALYNLYSGLPVHNNSKGCGGIMRVAPVGLANAVNDPKEAAIEGAYFARITHQHPLGYMPAAMLADLIQRIVYHRENMSLSDLIIAAKDDIAEIYREEHHIGFLTEMVDKAIALSGNNHDDLKNIHELGQGWVAEETLAIALYCALRHKDDFSSGIIAAVNHKGDSDSTGAVTGNILGAWLGVDAISEKWKKDLELYPVIIEIAENFCCFCRDERYDDHDKE